MDERAVRRFMKLLFVHQCFGALGGAEADIQITGREMSRRGHDLGFLHGPGTGRSEELWREIFTRRFRLPEGSRTNAVSTALDTFQPDAIYVHKMSHLDVLETLIRSGLPLVRKVHDHELYCMRGYKYNYFTRAICTRRASSYCVFPCLAFLGRNREGRFPVRYVSYREKRKELELNRQFDRLLVYSRYTGRELIRNGFNPDLIEVNVPIRCWGTEAAVSSFGPRNLILYAGQIVRGKGVDVLLKALSKVQQRFECLILGDGNHRGHCQRVCGHLGLDGRVQFRGFVLREELKKYYLESSVFVISSVWPEPFGLTGPEAMRYGLPVVAFDAGGIREWLSDGENGFLVPWMDTDRFAERIDELLRDKELGRRLGRRGLERVNEQYEAGRQMDKLEQLFQDLARTPAEDLPRYRSTMTPNSRRAKALVRQFCE